MTAPFPAPRLKLWPLSDLQAIVDEFLESARNGRKWDEESLVFTGKNNYMAIAEYIAHRAGSEKYSGHVCLAHREAGLGKGLSVSVSYSAGQELGRLKVIKASCAALPTKKAP